MGQEDQKVDWKETFPALSAQREDLRKQVITRKEVLQITDEDIQEIAARLDEDVESIVARLDELYKADSVFEESLELVAKLYLYEKELQKTSATVSAPEPPQESGARQIPDDVLQELINQAARLAIEVHYNQMPERGIEMPLLHVLRQIKQDWGLKPNDALWEDPQSLLGE